MLLLFCKNVIIVLSGNVESFNRCFELLHGYRFSLDAWLFEDCKVWELLTMRVCFCSIKLMMQYIHVLYTNTWMQTYSGFQKPESGVRNLKTFINIYIYILQMGYSVFALANTHADIYGRLFDFFFLSFF